VKGGREKEKEGSKAGRWRLKVATGKQRGEKAWRLRSDEAEKVFSLDLRIMKLTCSMLVRLRRIEVKRWPHT
jgi:hypothetical protein